MPCKNCGGAQLKEQLLVMVNEDQSTYTRAQRKALEAIKQPGLKLGAARAEFVNKVMLPDGSVNGDVDSLIASMSIAGRRMEIVRHIAENRFLFVVLGWPRISPDPTKGVIYFQCAVPGNLDVW